MITTDKELTYTVTEKEYKEGLAKGWTDDDMLKPGKYKVRRSRFVVKQENSSEQKSDLQLDKMKRLPRGNFKAKPNASKLENCKVKISLYIDGDILEYFRQRAEPPHTAPYQTQINNELQRIMENDSPGAASLEKDILNNEEFLRALKEKLATVKIKENISFASRIVDGTNDLSKFEDNWGEWQPMPTPKNCRNIAGPANSGVYQIRNKESNYLILFGIGKKCQKRMESLYPKPFGTGTRNNECKRKYILDNWKKLEYRTMETETIEEAKRIEDSLKANKNHVFNT